MHRFRLHAKTCLCTTAVAGVLRDPKVACHPLFHGMRHASFAGLSAADLTGIG